MNIINHYFVGDALHGKIFVRLQMNCSTSIEFAYYGSDIGRKDLWAHCGTSNSQKDSELMKKFKIVLPVCRMSKRAYKKEIPKNNHDADTYVK